VEQVSDTSVINLSYVLISMYSICPVRAPGL